MRQIATFLIFTLWVATVAAQDELIEQQLEQEIRRYRVEIIIFSYEENVSVGSEIFIPDELPVEEELLIDAEEHVVEPAEVATGEEDHEEELESIVRELDLVLLAEEELTLDKIARQFSLLDVYETIMHIGWIQPTYPEEETPPIELRILGEPPAGLDGSFTLYLSRYLHLVVDLALDAPEGFDKAIVPDEAFYSDDPTYSFGDSRLQFEDDQGPLPLRFRIQENRIVKNGELRYFDHPKFGVLAKITRFEEEEEAEEDELGEPLLSSARQ